MPGGGGGVGVVRLTRVILEIRRDFCLNVERGLTWDKGELVGEKPEFRALQALTNGMGGFISTICALRCINATSRPRVMTRLQIEYLGTLQASTGGAVAVQGTCASIFRINAQCD